MEFLKKQVGKLNNEKKVTQRVIFMTTWGRREPGHVEVYAKLPSLEGGVWEAINGHTLSLIPTIEVPFY